LEGQFTKGMSIFVMNPAKRTFFVALKVRNGPHGLKGLAVLITEAKLNVISGQLFSTDGGSILSLFADTEKGGLTAQELRERLLKLEGITEASVEADTDGLAVDTTGSKFMGSLGERSVPFRQKSLLNMFSMMRRQFGTGGEVILFEEGRRMGGDTGKVLLKALGADFIARHLDRVLSIWSASGWGQLRLDSYDPSSPALSITIKDSFECNGVRSDKPVSQLFRGHLEGAVSTLLGVRLRCQETACVAAGARECVFVLRGDES
jgi:predicted hydrocarbon binding protein